MSRHLLLLCLLPLACGTTAVVEDEGEEFPLPQIAWAPLHYVCPRAEPAPRLDGDLSDPAWARAPWTEDFQDIEGPAKPKPRFRTRAKMLWDDTCFYVAAELEEPDVWGTLTRRDSVVYHDNDFEVFIDPDGDTHEYYELEINALGTEWDLFLPKPYRDDGHGVDAFDIAGLRTAVRVDGTLNRPGDRDRGWTVEIAIPWAALAEHANRPSPPRPGDAWRVNFSRVEWRSRAVDGRHAKLTDSATGKPLPENNWVWSPQGLIAMHYPEMWGYVTFVDEDGPVFHPSRSVAEQTKRTLREVYYLEREFHARHGRYTADLPGLPAGVQLEATGGGFTARLHSLRGREYLIREDGRVREARP